MSEANAGAALVEGLRRAILAMLLILLASVLPAMLNSASRYRPFSLELAAYATLLLCALAVLRRTIQSGRRRLLFLVVFTASLAATWATPAAELLGQAHWSWRVAGWFAVLLLLDRPLAVTLAVLGGLLVPVLVQLAVAARLDAPSLVQLAIIGTLNTGAQVALAVGCRVARRAGDAADRIAAREAEVRTASLIADQVSADHQARYADLAGTTVPLLEGLRDGRLRPSDPATRLRCSIEAARLRRLMAEGDDVVDPLTHELRACVDLAERSGVRVEMAVCGSGPPLEPAVRRRLTEPMIEVLAQARSRARLTVVATDRDVVVSLVADVARETEIGRKDKEHDIVRFGDRLWVTARWDAPSSTVAAEWDTP